eukprot:CAMPEP_0170510908 /NCGR_PEP_ID=MMETSP0208-20121228/66016_1 /TAXON_ID=197538 /ORGANISM="Strombidium inclinatum, Strain S3" /LENGTH=61 /DNA_ID=CAMNT_0010794403 /DNA_START=35 /DNA_END=220 /DNA_ORIENTATION=+
MKPKEDVEVVKIPVVPNLQMSQSNSHQDLFMGEKYTTNNREEDYNPDEYGMLHQPPENQYQ